MVHRAVTSSRMPLAGLPSERWLRFAVPLCVALFALNLAAIWVAIAIGLR